MNWFNDWNFNLIVKISITSKTRLIFHKMTLLHVKILGPYDNICVENNIFIGDNKDERPCWTFKIIEYNLATY